MLKKIKKIAIIGGGTSAWFSAAYLSANTDFNVVVVDKEIGTPVGVGEGTLLGFENFLEECGFDQKEWMKECDATYKSGILFPEFGKKDSLIWHPFILSPRYEEFNSTLFEALTYVDRSKFNELSPFFNISIDNKVDLDNLQSYAYHVDCGKLVEYIQKKIKNKIRFVQSEVVKINYSETGNIDTLECLDNSIIEADLFLDCTGFKKLLSSKSECIDLSDRLFVDTAVAAHVSYQNESKEKNPYVLSHAVDHGWIWNIPVNTRIGTGMVFNRNITSIHAATEYFCQYWNNRITPADVKVIDWSPYYDKTPWQKNVVCFGLSAGFIEPLESTGLATVINCLINFTRLISPGYYKTNDIEFYNKFHVNLFEETADFVNMHYASCEINSEFWEFVKEKNNLSDIFFYYKNMIESGQKVNNEGKGYMFGGANWLCWMYQLLEEYPKNKNINKDTANRILANWYNVLQEADNKPQAVCHNDFLIQEYYR